MTMRGHGRGLRKERGNLRRKRGGLIRKIYSVAEPLSRLVEWIRGEPALLGLLIPPARANGTRARPDRAASFYRLLFQDDTRAHSLNPLTALSSAVARVISTRCV